MAKGAYIGAMTTTPSVGSLSVGDTVKINVSGVAKEFIVVHQGTPNSSYYVNADGTWVMAKELWAKYSWGNQYVYPNTDIHKYLLNSTFFNSLDAGVRNVIKQVNIPYYSYSDAKTFYGANGAPAKIFIPSSYEVGLNYSGARDGYLLSYFNGLPAAGRIAYYNGTATRWWTRSVTDSMMSVAVRENTGAYVTSYQSETYGIRPTFVLPSDTAVRDGFVDGSVAGTIVAARKITKCFIGIDGLARKIKKAYIGIGGVARPCFSGGELAYYGTITGFSRARYDLAAASVGNYALFGGGSRDGSATADLDYYSDSLTHGSQYGAGSNCLTGNRYELAATSVGGYALFGGGYTGGGTAGVVDAFDGSLTKKALKELSVSRYKLAATSVGDYALFGGGYNGDRLTTVDAYNNSLTRSIPTALSEARYTLAATSVGNYALFGGGFNGNDVSATTDAYNTSLSRVTATKLSSARNMLVATTVGDYALFGGGSGPSAVVDVYNKSLTKSVATALSQSRYRIGATSVGDYALFGGGYGSAFSSVVDVYDASLTKTTSTNLSVARRYLAATSVGNYAIFGGGMASGFASSAAVDVYTVA